MLKQILSAVVLLVSLPVFAEIYSPQDAFEDMMSEKLTFVGRDYPNADLGPGGNYVCIYKNSKVYVRHEGCRPSYTQSLAVFSAKIISRTGGLVEIYLEHNRENYKIGDAGPNFNGTWKLTSTNTEAFSGEPTFKEIIALERGQWNNNSNTCLISKSAVYPQNDGVTKCRGNASDDRGDLEQVWNNPFANRLQEAHDTILKAPRK